MKKKSIISLLMVSVIIISSCSKKSNDVVPVTPPIVTPPVVVTPIITTPAGWKLATSFNTSLPQGVQLFAFDSIYAGRKVKAYCLAYDSKNVALDFKPVLSATVKTPTAFLADEPGVSYACINAGFYGGGQSYSLVKYQNTVSSVNIRALNRTYNGASTQYFPTRGAFGISSTGVPSVAWIYNVGTTNNLIYSYPAPSPNQLNTAPQIQPTATFPLNGGLWDATTAIGGSPVLIKNNAIQITDSQEMIDINNTTSRPRSSIGYLNDGIVLIFAIEGDNLPDYPGVNLSELAILMKSFNCVEAMNLDGGGSTSMVVAGTKTVRPGDAGGIERAVQSAIIIKKK
jgi:Phosphodiester glycosidase